MVNFSGMCYDDNSVRPERNNIGEEDMSKEITKAILVVSFGTSFPDTRKRTIEAIEKDIAEAYPEYRVYRAWTSKMIMKKLLRTENRKIFSVREAMEAMIADGISEVIIQPTHVINGIENDLMKEDALAYASSFSRIRFGVPLLTSDRDNDEVIQAVAAEYSSLPEGSAVVLMGHGTTHYANAVYAALDYRFKDRGYPHIFLGTVEAYPSLDSLLRQVSEQNPRSVVLAPFMIVAGDHATNDMAGDNPDSWRGKFEEAGFTVSCVMKGLGEYPAIRRILLRHVAEAE